MKTFEGYRRTNGSIGVRNHVITINTVGELAGLTKKLAQMVPGVIPVAHQAGKAQYPEDLEQTIRTLKGTAGHPNVSAALFLGMGEDDPAEEIVEMLKEEGHHVHAITFQKDKTISEVLIEGKQWLEEALERSRSQQKESADITELIIGLECGGSDAWSGITANPAIGACSDSVVRDGGTSILAETTEAIGAEHILAGRAVDYEVREKFLKIVKDYEERIKETGEDIRSANPTPGNMAGGLTTLEEKSLGCIKKGGSSTLMEVIAYAEKPTKKGFVFMDTPGYDVESVAGLAAGGAQIVLFSTGKGSPTGSPIVPVIKIGTNPKLYEIMSEHIDVNAGKIIEGLNTIEEIGEEIYTKVMEAANGKLTAAEHHKNQEFAIWRLAQTM
ncbi:UxaA family hydrolase [Neobacillus rhizophilus]|uniref:UxaA family hydrolase n=1 Tax=Neobacillus rhizophilus TaxID=2833579 RepID=A0A942YZ07_9BACI|nr:UxaA family hydrolase [Neobacillus rhizophilus]MBS4216705.1 UxaA family hydrolase [Neobacillus rhizophilus]MBU8920212.1 UxaA family hydrolase [Bacillus sp. FJAT-29953]